MLFFYIFTIASPRGTSVVSEATSPKDACPLLELSGNKLSVLSLEQAENVLRVAGDRKMVELRACLEGLNLFLLDCIFDYFRGCISIN